MSSIAKNKEELINSITDISRKLFEDYRSTPHDITRETGVEGNSKDTFISICDTVAYLIGWGKLVIKWHGLKSENKEVDFPETGYKWNQLGQLAASFYETYHDWEFTDLLDEYERVLEEILMIINHTSNYDLYGKTWYTKWTLGRMIQFNTSAPMKNIRTKVRRFKKSKNIK